MTVQRAHYEELLAEYSNTPAAIALLKQHRPYLELIPSMRRPLESVIPMPLPVVRVRETITTATGATTTARVESLMLPCDVAILMCDPEWKIKTGAELFIFIHRPEEDFSDLLRRWRQTQVLLSKNYEWIMPPRYQHILTEGADKLYPLFVVFEDTPERVRRGLKGACLPVVTLSLELTLEEEPEDTLSDASSEVLHSDD